MIVKTLSHLPKIIFLIFIGVIIFILMANNLIANNQLDSCSFDYRQPFKLHVLREMEGRQEHIHLMPNGVLQLFQRSDCMITEWREGKLKPTALYAIQNTIAHAVPHTQETFYLPPPSPPDAPLLIRETDSLIIEVIQKDQRRFVYCSNLGEAPRQVQDFYERLTAVAYSLLRVDSRFAIQMEALDEVPLRERLYRFTNKVQEPAPTEAQLALARGVIFISLRHRELNRLPAVKKASQRPMWAVPMSEKEIKVWHALGIKLGKPHYLSYENLNFRVWLLSAYPASL